MPRISVVQIIASIALLATAFMFFKAIAIALGTVLLGLFMFSHGVAIVMGLFQRTPKLRGNRYLTR